MLAEVGNLPVVSIEEVYEALAARFEAVSEVFCTRVIHSGSKELSQSGH